MGVQLVPMPADAARLVWFWIGRHRVACGASAERHGAASRHVPGLAFLSDDPVQHGDGPGESRYRDGCALRGTGRGGATAADDLCAASRRMAQDNGCSAEDYAPEHA